MYATNAVVATFAQTVIKEIIIKHHEIQSWIVKNMHAINNKLEKVTLN